MQHDGTGRIEPVMFFYLLVLLVSILFLTSSTIYGMALSGKGDTQLTLISQSVYFSCVFSVLIRLIKKSASHITGIISFLILVICCNCGTHFFSMISRR